MTFNNLSEVWSYYDVKDRKHFDNHDLCAAIAPLKEGPEQIPANHGHKRKRSRSKSFWVGKIQSAWRKLSDFARDARIFPWDSVKFFCHFVLDGIRLVVR